MSDKDDPRMKAKQTSKKRAAAARAPRGASPAAPKPKPARREAAAPPAAPVAPKKRPAPRRALMRDLENAPTTVYLPREDEIAPEVASERTPRRPEAAADGDRGPRESPAPAVIAQIRELEAQLDRLIDEASRRDLSSLAGDDDHEELEAEDDGSDLEVTRDARPEMLARLANARVDPEGLNETQEITSVETQEIARVDTPPGFPPPRPSSAGRPSSPALPNEATVFDTARELLSSDFYLRKWGRLAMRGRSEEVDDFGFDPIYEQKARAVLEFLYTRYFRVETTGIERVPARGRCLLVANHSGTLPLDGVMIKTAVKLEHAAPRDVRWLTEDFIYHMPYLGSIMNRLGAVRACQENAERLLNKEMLCAVFPEGVKGIGKLFAERYRLQRFGRGGFIKLCLRTNTPIIPVAVVGAEETNPLLFRIEYLSKALGLPYVPVTPTFPALGPLGLLPAPTKWQIHFGEPIDISSHGRDAADDDLLVGKLAERVRATIQGMLDRAVGSRKSVFFG